MTRSVNRASVDGMIFSVFMLLPLSGHVLAQGGALQLEEIVVTAEYREENLQDVPVSVTAFSADDIARSGIESTQDFINLTPNMTLDDSFTLGNTFVQVRGVAQINNADSPVAIVVDGVPQNNQKQLKQALFDIERIEVLKGPQGSLYGRNAIGGAINIVSKIPGNDLEGKIRAGTGNGGLAKVSGALGGALVADRLLFRLSGAFKDFNGVTENSFLGQDVDFYTSRDIRGRLLWQVSDTLSVDGRLAFSDADGGCCSDTFIPNPNLPRSGANPASNTFTRPYTNVLGETDKKRFIEGTVKINWDTRLGAFTYILGVSDVEETYFADLDFTNNTTNGLSAFLGGLIGVPLGVGQQQILDVALTSHELRLTSPDEQRLRWIAGLYYLDTERDLTTLASVEIPGTALVSSRASFSSPPFLNIAEENNNRAFALFGQAEYDLTDELELTLGLRYDYDERKHQALSPTTNTPEKSFSDLQPRIVLSKRWGEDVLSYASYSRGFRSGGFNGPALASRPFKEETLDNVELGFKSTWFERRLLVNGALFYAKSDNFQYFRVDIATASQIIENIDKVDMLGVELDFQALLAERWTLFGALGITDSEIKTFASRPQDEGKRTPKNQQYSLNIGTEYRLPLAGEVEGSLRIDYEHRGKKYWHSDNLNPMGDFGLLGGRAALTTENWTVLIWAKNIFDELYWQDYNAATFAGTVGGDIGFLARGRTYGIDLEYRF